MVAGKLLILLVSTPVLAEDISNPRFFNYNGGGFLNYVAQFSFGWFRTLTDEESAAYNQAVTHAVMFAENGQVVKWYEGRASGAAVPVMTWPTGSGYCRRIHLQAIAYGQEKTMSQTACFQNIQDKWRWVRE